MRLERSRARKGPVRQMEDVILFAVHDMRFAIAASAVDEIRNLDGLTAFKPSGYAQSRFAKVKFTLVREKKDRNIVYFAVDAALHFHLPASRASRVLVLRNSRTAVLVENIDRMMQIGTVYTMPLAFYGEERDWYRGFAVLEGRVVPVVNPDSFLNKGEAAVLQATMKEFAAAGAPAKGVVSA